eukprot:Clim_evm85s157 gene=Clim_evmTU85s157
MRIPEPPGRARVAIKIPGRLEPDRQRKAVHAIDRVLRQRILVSVYFKEKCYGLNAATLCDRAVELDCYGGVWNATGAPTAFLCLLERLIQLEPELGIIEEYIRQAEFKYLRILGALYLRIVGTPVQVFTGIEPLLQDWRKVRFIEPNGKYVVTYIDQVADDILRLSTVAGTTLPHLKNRVDMELQDEIDPRESEMMDRLEDLEDTDEGATEAMEFEDKRTPEELSPDRRRGDKSGPGPPYDKEKRQTAAQSVSKYKGNRSLLGPQSIEDWNKFRAKLGLKPLRP